MYKLTNQTAIIRVSDNAYIPADEGNSDYINYINWLELGNIPKPSDADKEIYTCSPWQIRKALNETGQREIVESAVKMSEDIMIKDGWEFATSFNSNDPFVISMGKVLGKNEEETSKFIEYAATL